MKMGSRDGSNGSIIKEPLGLLALPEAGRGMGQSTRWLLPVGTTSGYCPFATVDVALSHGSQSEAHWRG